MNKMTRKFVVAIMALILTAIMMVTVSYAWMTLSATPVAEGIQITIGGGNTILVAPDQTRVVDGKTFHFPGHFDLSLNFSQYETYDYLKTLSVLTPVSTADGIHWFIPDYYDFNDAEVLAGNAMVGTPKPIEEFFLDRDMQYANVPSSSGDVANYIYLDFWVVSPRSDYTLRVSRGDENGGSFALELMPPEQSDEEGYVLMRTQGSAAASIRIGFLVDDGAVTDESMRYYQSSFYYSSNYEMLKGNYRDPKDSYWFEDGYRFTIYEPNADAHPGGTNGEYVVTSPIAWDGEKAVLADVRSQLTVQLTNAFRGTGSENGLPFEEVFAVWKTGKNLDHMTADEVSASFYRDYMQYQLMPYVTKGYFLKKTTDLYAFGDTVSAEDLAQLDKAGATDDSYIVKLEKNVPQRIRMFIWLEGQDIDCSNSAGAQDIVLGVELAGSNQ